MNKLFLIIGMSFIVLFAGLSAVDIIEANDIIYACKHKDEGMLRMVEDHSYCRPSEEPVSWSATGGLDVSKLYKKYCFDSFDCECDSVNDILISGGADCKVDNSIGEVAKLSRALHRSTEPRYSVLCSWIGTPTISEANRADTIVILCYEP